jgi:protein-L-isoaspartate(D-aspartate) O-methyltransferase
MMRSPVQAFVHLLAAGSLFAQDFPAARQRMVKQQIEDRGIRHPGVLKAMRDTPRHLFVPEALQSRAYDDTPLPIGLGQTISQPYIVASMTEMLAPAPHHQVLEIGTGSGYQAAVLSPLVAHVYTIEIVEPLARQAEALFRRLGYRNITTRVGDGYQGWPEKAPFDRIIVTAAPPELPQELVKQLKNGGRLVAPVGREYQELIVVEKDAQGRVTQRREYPVMFVPMVPGKR